jgi:hypothetical protein
MKKSQSTKHLEQALRFAIGHANQVLAAHGQPNRHLRRSIPAMLRKLAKRHDKNGK